MCPTCGQPTSADVRSCCTPYTCTTPCTICGHPGAVHRDWYRDLVGTGFCRRCAEGEPGHDYTPVLLELATAPKEN